MTRPVDPQDLTSEEMAGLPHRAVVYDLHNDPLIKLSSGWVYMSLLPNTIEEQAALGLSFHIRKPRLHGPYSLQKKEGVR